MLARFQPDVRNDIVVANFGSLGITEYVTIASVSTGGPNYQVYMNDKPMTLARYPNASTLSLGQALDIGETRLNCRSESEEPTMEILQWL